MFGLDLVHLLFSIGSKTNEVLICAVREELQLVFHVHVYHPGGPDFLCNSSKQMKLLKYRYNLEMFQNEVLIVYKD